jgi:hypothetical protein
MPFAAWPCQRKVWRGTQGQIDVVKWEQVGLHSFFKQVNKRNGLTIGWAINGGIDRAPTSQIKTHLVLMLGAISIHSPWVGCFGYVFSH